MLSKELEFTLNHAFNEAREKRYEFITVEHLLLALLDNPTAAEVLRACGADLERIRADLQNFLEETTPLLSPRWASSGSCSAPCCTCSLPARRR